MTDAFRKEDTSKQELEIAQKARLACAMRELDLDEMEAAAGAGWFSNWCKSLQDQDRIFGRHPKYI
jgi:hypothetical protein